MKKRKTSAEKWEESKKNKTLYTFGINDYIVEVDKDAKKKSSNNI